MKHTAPINYFLTRPVAEVEAMIALADPVVGAEILRSLETCVEQACAAMTAEMEPDLSHVCAILIGVNASAYAVSRARILLQASNFYAQTGATDQAIYLGQQALALARARGDWLLETLVLANMAALLPEDRVHREERVVAGPQQTGLLTLQD